MAEEAQRKLHLGPAIPARGDGLQLLGASVGEDVPVYPAVPVEVRFALYLVPVLQDPEDRLDGPLADIEKIETKTASQTYRISAIRTNFWREIGEKIDLFLYIFRLEILNFMS
jgi:hypothetical protein